MSSFPGTIFEIRSLTGHPLNTTRVIKQHVKSWNDFQAMISKQGLWIEADEGKFEPGSRQLVVCGHPVPSEGLAQGPGLECICCVTWTKQLPSLSPIYSPKRELDVPLVSSNHYMELCTLLFLKLCLLKWMSLLATCSWPIIGWSLGEDLGLCSHPFNYFTDRSSLQGYMCWPDAGKESWWWPDNLFLNNFFIRMYSLYEGDSYWQFWLGLYCTLVTLLPPSLPLNPSPPHLKQLQEVSLLYFMESINQTPSP
jgi:hypothetical protein